MDTLQETLLLCGIRGVAQRRVVRKVVPWLVWWVGVGVGQGLRGALWVEVYVVGLVVVLVVVLRVWVVDMSRGWCWGIVREVWCG